MSPSKADINYFIALMTAGSMLSLWFIAPFVGVILLSMGAGIDSMAWSKVVAIALVFVAIIFIWVKNGALSPASIKTGREKRYRTGRVLTGLGNIALVLAVVASIAAHFTIHNFGLAIGFLLAGALLIAVPLNIVGIVCIETSRQRK